MAYILRYRPTAYGRCQWDDLRSICDCTCFHSFKAVADLMLQRLSKVTVLEDKCGRRSRNNACFEDKMMTIELRNVENKCVEHVTA